MVLHDPESRLWDSSSKLGGMETIRHRVRNPARHAEIPAHRDRRGTPPSKEDKSGLRPRDPDALAQTASDSMGDCTPAPRQKYLAIISAVARPFSNLSSLQ